MELNKLDWMQISGHINSKYRPESNFFFPEQQGEHFQEFNCIYVERIIKTL